MSVAYHEGRFPPAALDLGALFPLVGPANAAIARYEGVLAGIPNPDILLSPLTAREAVLSSKMERRAAERDKDALLARSEELRRQNDMLLQEMKHRVANSLQIIASILMQSARKMQSDEARSYLSDAHQRVMSISTLQRHLAESDGKAVELQPYLAQLCASIGASMIYERGQLTLTTRIDPVSIDGDTSVSMGLVVTELVINALKHAFPDNRPGSVIVDYAANGDNWTLSVSDDGIGMLASPEEVRAGLGTRIIQALAKQLRANITVTDAAPGTKVSLTHTAQIERQVAATDKAESIAI